MMNQSEVKMFLANFFEAKGLLFEGSYIANENGQQVTKIVCFGSKGRFEMKLTKNRELYTMSTDRKRWIQIDNYLEIGVTR
ncbi:hypothetical protein ACYSNR_03145 [Enterococcus sp. LJL128]